LADTNQQVAEQKVYFSGVDAELPIAQELSVGQRVRKKKKYQGLGKWGRKRRIEQEKQRNKRYHRAEVKKVERNEYPCNSSQAFESRKWKREKKCSRTEQRKERVKAEMETRLLQPM
jgi:hypothetical protein